MGATTSILVVRIKAAEAICNIIIYRNSVHVYVVFLHCFPRLRGLYLVGYPFFLYFLKESNHKKYTFKTLFPLFQMLNSSSIIIYRYCNTHMAGQRGLDFAVGVSTPPNRKNQSNRVSLLSSVPLKRIVGRYRI